MMAQSNHVGTAPNRVGTRLLCALIGAFALACLLAAPASAAFYRHPLLSQFGPDGTANTKFQKDSFIAVDQSSHDVYVADDFAHKVYRFSGAGAPHKFSEGPGAGKNAIPIPIPAGTSIFDEQSAITGIAVAPAGAAGGTAGDLYVSWSVRSDSTGAFIWGVEIYSPTGAHLGTLDGSGNPHHPPSGPTGVAVDAAGSVYLGYGARQVEHHVDKYVPNANPVTEARFDSEISNAGGALLAAPAGLYVSEGSLNRYAYSLFPGGGGSADASGQGVPFPLPSGVRSDVAAVDGASEDLYLPARTASSEGFELYGASQFDKEGNELSFIQTDKFEFGPGGVALGVEGIGVDAGTGRLYLSVRASKVGIYGPAELLTPPSATIDTPTSVTYRSAHLTGTVNPGGTGEGYETTYRFQCTPSCPGLNIPRELPADGADHEVSDDASELQPETKYEVALIATNGYGHQTVEDTTSFETPAKPPVTAPAVTIDPVTSHTATSAHLSGTVDPMGTGAGQETTYRFEYTADGLKWITLPDQGPIEGSGPQAVSAELEGLQPNTTYSVRLHAVNDGGEDTSGAPDPSFTTDPLAPEVEVGAATHVLEGSAQLNATIEPHNSQTSYYFEWGSADCASNPCAAIPASKDADAGADPGTVFVNVQVDGLSPQSTYHYRVIAESTAGTATSPDASFTTPAAAGPCQNQRVGASAALPDCRAYEMVSPLEKHGGAVAGISFRTRASADGDAVAFVSQAGFADTPGFPYSGAEYMSTRDAQGWSTHSITPFKKAPLLADIFTNSGYVGEFSADLEHGIYRALPPNPDAGPNAEGVTDLYLASGMREGKPQFTLLSDSVNPLGFQPYDIGRANHIYLVDTSADFSHVLFEDTDDLTADASGTGPKLYEWVDGSVRLAGILPDSACGSPPCPAGESAGGGGAWLQIYDYQGNTQQQNAISEDGSRVFFTGGPLKNPLDTTDTAYEGSLYMREDGTHTVQIDASERSVADPDGHGRSQFEWASPDGSEVLFFSREELVDGDRDGEVRSLYRYRVEAPAGQHLSMVVGAGQTHVIGGSEDGAYVYLANGYGGTIYVLHGGEIRKAAESTGADLGVRGIEVFKYEQTRMAPSGRFLLFPGASPTLAEQTGHDVDPHRAGVCYPNKVACHELYLYSYEDNEVVCVSCDPSGNPPGGDVGFNKPIVDAGVNGGGSTYLNTPLSGDGRYVFFSSPDALVAKDSNGRYDAYVYDVAKREVRLLSSGQCNCDSVFVDASADGRDAFFTTAQQLVRADTDNLADLYDARVGGGIAAQNAPAPAECQGDACQPAPSAPNDPTPASSAFNGAGNVVPRKCKGKHRRCGHHRKHHHKKQAHTKRRAGK